VILGTSPEPRIVCLPGQLSGVWLGLPPGDDHARAIAAMAMLAYEVFDYVVRESVRGLAMFRPDLANVQGEEELAKRRAKVVAS
jgi:Mg2+/citrate symporter